MYRTPHENQLAFDDAVKDFVLPFGGTLRSDNCWVLPAKHIPWAEVETAYAQQFAQGGAGITSEVLTSCAARAHPTRTPGNTDRKLVEQIAETHL